MSELLIEITESPIDDASVFRHLLQLYVYDFSEIEGFDLNEHGLYRYRYLDNYWSEEDRHPFLVRVDGKLAGFVLVNTLTSAAEADFSIAEFFILRKYRRRGVGTQVAHRIFDMYPGWWEMKQTKKNIAAQSFWRKTVSSYNANAHRDYPVGTGTTDRPLQTVKSRLEK